MKIIFARTKIVVFFFIVVILNNSFTLYIPNGNTENWLKGTWQGMGVQIENSTQLHSWSMIFYATPKKTVISFIILLFLVKEYGNLLKLIRAKPNL